MSNYNLTKTQNEVIKSDLPKLLVSASAGTGKTFVMVERVCDLLINKGKDISNFLVVTFTAAAANEMKERITMALNEKIGENPSLKKQIKKLPLSSISTFHSFCKDIINRYFYVANLPPKFKIIDENKSVVLKNKVMNDILEDKYENSTKEFSRLLDILGTNRKESGLTETIISLYNFSRSMENPTAFLSDDFSLKDDKVYQNILLNGIDRKLIRFKLALENTLITAISCNAEKDRDVCRDSLEKISEALNKKTLKEKAEYCGSVKFMGLKKADSEAISHKELGKIKTDLSSYFTTISSFLSFIDTSSYKDIIKGDLKTLSDLCIDFSIEYAKIKRKNDYLDFSDLEHFALDILSNDEVKRDVREKYEYVFVDEYQDTSKVQEAIIKGVSKNNLFVVGDIKQSIYAFRQCDKDIFMEKELTYGKDEGSKVFYLQDNFRSSNNILTFVNKVFSNIMTAPFGTDYKSTSMFNVSDKVEGNVEVDIIDVTTDKNVYEGKVYSVKEDISELVDLKAGEKEGKFVAEKILSIVGREMLINGKLKKVDYSDFAILVRSINDDKSSQIYKMLVESGIPVTISSSEDLLCGYSEVETCANFLKVLQNPCVDIPLLSVLKSPFFSFTDGELVKIHKSSPNLKFFYEAFFAARDNENFVDVELKNKIKGFFDSIEYYRNVALARGGSFALTRAINETNFSFYLLSKPDGKEHLQKVSDFIVKIDALDDNKNLSELNANIDVVWDTLKANSSLNPSGSVRFITIHKSKGLEFPIVFLCNATKNFRTIKKDKVLFHKSLGGSMKFFDTENRKVTDSLYYSAQKTLMDDETIEEEMRLLYVALTRAKSQLFITGTNNKKDLNEIEDLKVLPINSSDDVYSANSYIDFILGSISARPYAKMSIVNKDFDSYKPNVSQFVIDGMAPRSTDSLIANFNYSYPHNADTTLPTKLAASNLKRQFYVEEEVSYSVIDHLVESSAKIGTAYHKLLELAAPKSTLLNVKEKLQYMIDNSLITEQIAEKIDCQKVYEALNCEIMSFGKAYGEKPFMIAAPANMFSGTKSDSLILLQGVVDLILVNDKNEAVIIDYKFTSEKNKQVLLERYGEQLKIYKYAVSNILNLKVVNAYILNLANFALIAID